MTQTHSRSPHRSSEDESKTDFGKCANDLQTGMDEVTKQLLELKELCHATEKDVSDGEGDQASGVG